VVDRLVGERATLRGARERMRRRQLLCRLHALFGTVDAALLDDLESMADWVRLQRGELLFEQNDHARDGVYFVVSGRVRTLAIDRDGTRRVLGEAGCGDSVGESSVFGVATRDERVQAMRDSVLVGFTNAEFDQLVARRPHLLRRVAGSVVRRMQHAASHRHDGVIATIAVVPAGAPEALDGFCERLVAALSKHGPTLWLDAERVEARMREPGIAQSWDDGSGAEHLLAWLEAQERTHRFVVYQADQHASAWTRRCMRQADRVLYVARAGGEHALGPIEAGLRELDGGAVQAHSTLVLVHPVGRERPTGTRRWLAAREVNDHLHVRWTRPTDFARLARTLAGRAVTLVLGGGGARGFAHIGILRALEELGVPVDAICGTSMGASIAAQYAMGWTNRAITETNRLVWVKLHPHTKLTLPVLSIVGNEESTKCGELLYGDAEIEDLWLPYFCVSSNLATADVMVHRSGSLLWAATASASLPGFAVPVLHGDQLLVDGALLDNVPTELARRMWGGFVIAAEVSVEDDAAFRCSRIRRSGRWCAAACWATRASGSRRFSRSRCGR
jgi:predicted acylesterase/phospholipase RssA/CRP-like cAMP-binding protein